MNVATEAYFRGRWQMARLIETPTGGSIGEFWGEACFEPPDDAAAGGRCLVCRESGVLRFEGHDYASGRVTIWRFNADHSVEVSYADGRPFHAFTPGEPRAVHLCGADRYEVGYEFAHGTWWARWRVTGPAKDYWMTTRYQRIDEPRGGGGVA